MRICCIEGCNRKHKGHGFCDAHLKRFRKYGDANIKHIHPKKYTECIVEGCHREPRIRGICSMHASRFANHGNFEPLRNRCGLSKLHPAEHKCWCSLKNRCNNKNCLDYKDYGGRGIKVCERWSGVMGFENFYNDMGDKPSIIHSIDRIDVDGDYCPENCKWSTPKEQANNRRVRADARLITAYGKTQTLVEWARELGLKVNTIESRRRAGKTDEDLLAPARSKTPSKRHSHKI